MARHIRYCDLLTREKHHNLINLSILLTQQIDASESALARHLSKYCMFSTAGICILHRHKFHIISLHTVM